MYKSDCDNIEILMIKLIELFNQVMISKFKEISIQNLNVNTLNLVQEHKTIIIPLMINTESFSFNRHMANITTVSFNAQGK